MLCTGLNNTTANYIFTKKNSKWRLLKMFIVNILKTDDFTKHLKET